MGAACCTADIAPQGIVARALDEYSRVTALTLGERRRRVTAAESPHANENKWVIIKMVEEEEEEEEKECK